MTDTTCLIILAHTAADGDNYSNRAVVVIATGLNFWYQQAENNGLSLKTFANTRVTYG